MTDERLRILIVEDHRDIAANIGDYLRARGHAVELAYDGISAMQLAMTGALDVIVLDIGLPRMDGLTLCKRLRADAETSIPILMLTARDTLADRLEGFRAGTDDYVTKPFSLEELSLRVAALARRSRGRPRQDLLRVADLELDVGTYVATRAGKRLELNPTSVKILAELMRESPKLVTRQKLEQMLWGDALPASDALRSQIYILRSAIDKGHATPLLHTVHGVGYRLVADP